jgi:filamentous hemagglutinin family protein
MIQRSCRGFKSGLPGAGICWIAIAHLNSAPILAQITPDGTLGNEPSVVTPQTNIRGLPGVLIRGGAARGRNLFQSFQDFNVGDGQRVYFANPAGVEAILSRVTGSNPSRILGTLGVDGAANLFFLNPNGILFGSNARLDIAGSFVASTADRLTFDNGLTFSAKNPDAPPLLTVTLHPNLPYGTNYQAAISNAGNLAVGIGQTLSLQGTAVTSSGGLTAPAGTVQLLGDRIALVSNARIDVSGAGGGGTVLIGGDFQGKGAVPNASQAIVDETVVINADAVGSGDGGRVIVWADGATRFSGRISARGGETAGNGGFVEVSGKQTLDFNGRVDTTAAKGHIGSLLLDPFDFEVNAANVGSINQSPTTVTIAAENNITFSTPINMTAFQAGLSADAGNSIFVNSDITTNGGDVILTAANGVLLNSVTINTNPFENTANSVAGAIVLAGGNQVSVLNSSLLSRGNNDQASFSAIGVVSANGSVQIDHSFISTTNFGAGFAGDVVITARDQVDISHSQIFSQGNQGRIYIGAADYDGFDFSPQTVEITSSQLQTSNGATASASADAGNIIVQALESVSIAAHSTLRSRAESNKQGNAGGIGIGTGTLYIQDSNLDTSTFAQNSSAFNFDDFGSSPDGFSSSFAGAVVLLAIHDITLQNSDIFNNLENGASGKAGVIYINARSLSLLNGAQIQTLVRGADANGPAAEGSAGNILIQVDQTVKVIGRNSEGFASAIFSSVGSESLGAGGNVVIQARSLHVRDGATINVDNAGFGIAGNIKISALGVWLDNGASIRASTFFGFGGNVILDVPGAIILGRDSGIFASTRFSPAGAQGGGSIAIGSGQLRPFIGFSRGIQFSGLEFDGSTLLVAGKTNRDNNILARGFEASGGVIRINAFRLQDIGQRPDTFATNDISTASFFDVDGLAVVNAVNIFPSFRVDPLPERPEIPKIAEGCDPRVRQESSQFVVSGRGGLPPNAADGLNQNALVDTRSVPVNTSQGVGSGTLAIAPARGWIHNPNGTIRLVAQALNPSIAPPVLWYSPPCYAP